MKQTLVIIGSVLFLGSAVLSSAASVDVQETVFDLTEDVEYTYEETLVEEVEEPAAVSFAMPQVGTFNSFTDVFLYIAGFAYGLPGEEMHEKVAKCTGSLTAFFAHWANLSVKTFTNPLRSIAEYGQDVNDSMSKSIDAFMDCYRTAEHVRDKYNAFIALIADLVAAEIAFVNDDYYNFGLRLGYALSRLTRDR